MVSCLETLTLEWYKSRKPWPWLVVWEPKHLSGTNPERLGHGQLLETLTCEWYKSRKPWPWLVVWKPYHVSGTNPESLGHGQLSGNLIM